MGHRRVQRPVVQPTQKRARRLYGKSPFSLYDYGLATYDRDTTFDEKASAGFIEIDTLSLKTWAKVQGPSSAAAQA